MGRDLSSGEDSIIHFQKLGPGLVLVNKATISLATD